jgi:UDP-galactopyranose mutase
MPVKQYDFVVVGSGLFGSVFAQQAIEHGKSVVVLEKRDHIAGNCFSYKDAETGIIVHKYGTHIFHTPNRKIWDYVTRFSEFSRYRHRVLTTHKGRVYSMPINLGTINAFYGIDLTPHQVDDFLASKRGDISKPKNLQEKAISLIGKDLYEAFVAGYTEKQWQCDPRDLPASIINRLPVRHSYNDCYFDDAYQGLPVDGYTPIFERLLAGAEVHTETDFFADRDFWLARAKRLIYTGPIDQYFEYCHGRLNWRSVRFEIDRPPVDDFQGTSVMNFADLDIPYTRIHEPKHLHPERTVAPGVTVAIREYSHEDNDQPYYPVNFPKDRKILKCYEQLISHEGKVRFGGRLAQYKYFDMHHVIALALKAAGEELRT